MIMKYIHEFIVISLCMFVLSCEDEWIKIELNKEIKNYDEIVVTLFDDIKSRKKENNIYYITGDEETIEHILEIVSKLSYTKSINDTMIDVKAIPSNKKQKRIFVRYKEDISDDIQSSLEIFFELKNKKHLENINGYSYTAPSSIEVKTLVMYLKSLSYIVHIEEDHKIKMF